MSPDFKNGTAAEYNADPFQNTKEDDVPPVEEDAADDDLYNEGGEDDEMEEDDDNEIDAVQLSQFSSQCLLSFKVENNTNLTKVIELQITPAMNESGLPVPLNFRCPASTIPCQVFANHSTAVVNLTKLDANVADWGSFSWSFTIQDKQKNQYAAMNSG